MRITPTCKMLLGGGTLLAALSSCTTLAVTEGANSRSVAFMDADVVDVVNGIILQDQTVIVTDGQITALGPEARIPRGARRIDAAGKVLIPGLWDMHTHVTSAGDCTLPVLAMHGITGIRDMGSDDGGEQLARWREAVRAGRLVGPDIYMARTPIESRKWLTWVEKMEKRPWREAIGIRVPVGSPAEAVAAVQTLKAEGADLIKFRNIEEEEGENYRAMLLEAKRLGLPVAGHAAQGTVMNEDLFNTKTAGLIGTAGRGVKSLEHIDFLHLGDFDDGKRRAVFNAMRENGTMVTPTTVAIRARLATRERLQREMNDDGTLLPDVSPALRAKWKKTYHQVQDFDWTKILSRADADARLAYAAGVDFLVGSDLGVITVIPGSSIHDELAIMVNDLGMTPAVALRSATYNAAKYFGKQQGLGSIAVGQRADILMLDANPIENISATRSISGMMLRGEYFDRAHMDRIRATTRNIMQQGGRCVTASPAS